MALKFVFQSFETESVKKGKAPGYEKGVVNYTYNGDPRTYKLVSFASPEIFGTLKTLAGGTTILVEVAKDDAGYNKWTSVQVEGAPSPSKGATAASTGSPAVRVAGSNYETPDERKLRQLLIVRQSSLGHAVEILKTHGKPFVLADALPIAKEAVSWVYGVEDALGDDNPEVGQD